MTGINLVSDHVIMSIDIIIDLLPTKIKTNIIDIDILPLDNIDKVISQSPKELSKILLNNYQLSLLNNLLI